MKNKLEEVAPELMDESTKGETLQQLFLYAQAMGFDPEEIRHIREPKLLLVLYKAMMYDHIQHLHEAGQLN